MRHAGIERLPIVKEAAREHRLRQIIKMAGEEIAAVAPAAQMLLADIDRGKGGPDEDQIPLAQVQRETELPCSQACHAHMTKWHVA